MTERLVKVHGSMWVSDRWVSCYSQITVRLRQLEGLSLLLIKYFVLNPEFKILPFNIKVFGSFSHPFNWYGDQAEPAIFWSVGHDSP